MPDPSSIAYVPFVSVANMMALVNAVGVEETLKELAAFIEADFLRWEEFDKTPRVASHSSEGVIELMPTADRENYGFKYVNGHPKNRREGYQTVAAFGVLASVSNGYPILLTEMTLLTALRTAATSALVARYLAPSHAKSMAMIGNGAQCEFQALAFKALCGIEEIRLFDVDPMASRKAARHLEKFGLEAKVFSSGQAAIGDAEIITTCTADKKRATILTDNMVGAGVHINAIGGDCPGKTELHRDILLRSRIFVEYTQQTRIEGDIQQLEKDHPVTEIWKVMAGKARGRQSPGDISVFDSVGFAIEDFSALRYVHATLQDQPFYEALDLLADPDDTRDLFGMLMRAREGE